MDITTFNGKRVGYDWPVQRAPRRDDGLTIPARPARLTNFNHQGGTRALALSLGISPEAIASDNEAQLALRILIVVSMSAFALIIGVCLLAAVL